jgi:hypothetical protein
MSLITQGIHWTKRTILTPLNIADRLVKEIKNIISLKYIVRWSRLKRIKKQDGDFIAYFKNSVKRKMYLIVLFG